MLMNESGNHGKENAIRKVYIWGAGYYCDLKKQGTEWRYGLFITAPDVLENAIFDYIFISPQSYRGIEKQCRRRGISLANNSSVIILHSKSSARYIPNVRHNRKKAVYVPHIIYTNHNNTINPNDIRKKYGVSEKDFLFTIFGGVKPYKNIEQSIEVFHRLHLDKAKLLIAGYPYNVGYAKRIRMLCRENQNIILDFRFIPDETLDSIIDISDVILLPYKEGSSMNSGVMIKAFSQGKTIIVPDICMARDVSDKKFFYMYKESFEEAMVEAYQNGKDENKRMGEAARDYVYKFNNSKIVGKRLDKILG